VDSFKFELDDYVAIDCSAECGTVIGRAEYLTGLKQYLIRYQAADLRAVEQWWDENALDFAPRC